MKETELTVKRQSRITELQAALADLPGDVNATARDYLESQIRALQNAIDSDRQAEAQRIEDLKRQQDALDKTASNAAAEEIFDWARPFLLTQTLELSKRDKLRLFCLEQVEKSKGVRNKVVAARIQ